MGGADEVPAAFFSETVKATAIKLGTLAQNQPEIDQKH